jgi:hypothetical protein
VSTGLISLPSAHGNGSSSLALLPLPSLRSATGPASHRATAHAALASSLSLSHPLTRGTRPSGPSSTSGQRRKCRVVARASQPRCHHLAPAMRQGSRRSFQTPHHLSSLLSLSLLLLPRHAAASSPRRTAMDEPELSQPHRGQARTVAN